MLSHSSAALAQRQVIPAPGTSGGLGGAIAILYFVFGPIVLLASVSEAVVGAIKGKNVLYNRYDVVIESVAFRLVASGILTALPFIFIRFHLFGFGGE